jgi:ribonuclease HI
MGVTARHVTIWSDSQYAIYCATGVWQRKKNTDLWPILDKQVGTLGKNSGVTIKWVKGHAGNRYNEIADEVATRAAFDFNEEKYSKFRAAQQATGQEMPGQSALKEQGVTYQATEARATSEPVDIGAWSPNADYMLVLNTQIVKGGHPIKGPRQGEYRLWARDGRNRTHTLSQAHEQAPDEAEYTTLIHALDQVAAKIGTAGRKTSDYSLIVYSRMELMIKQLTGEYRVKAPTLQNAYAEASSLIRRFKKVDLLYRDGKAIKQMMQE